MAKRVEIDGTFYRVRRGVLVEIPRQWVGKVTTKKTIRDRKAMRRGRTSNGAKGADTYRGTGFGAPRRRRLAVEKNGRPRGMRLEENES